MVIEKIALFLQGYGFFATLLFAACIDSLNGRQMFIGFMVSVFPMALGVIMLKGGNDER